MGIDVEKFKRIKSNTACLIPAVDANALVYAINTITTAKAYIETDDYQNFVIIYCGRPAMDGSGMIVGEESFSIKIPCHKKKDFGIVNTPYCISEDIIFLTQLSTADITISCPEEDESEEINDDEEYLGYIEPDEDFAYQELLSYIELALPHLPEAIYEDGVWVYS